MSSYFKPLRSLTTHQPYTPLDILAGYTHCFIDAKQPSTLEKCTKVPALYKKEYAFDPMTAKLFNVVSIGVLEEHIPIRFSNAKSLITDGDFVNVHFGGSCVYDCTTRKVEMVTLNLNPSNGVQDLDALYNKISHEFAHFAMAIVVSPGAPCSHAMLPYNSPENKSAFLQSATNVFSSLLQEAGIALRNPSFEATRKAFCIHSDRIKEAHVVSAAKTASQYGPDSESFLHAITKYEEYNTVNEFACDRNHLNLIEQKMAVRHFEQIPNGLQSDIGTHHQDLHHLKPMVDYTLQHLYPLFDTYIANKCAESAAYRCVIENNTLISITLLEPMPHPSDEL